MYGQEALLPCSVLGEDRTGGVLLVSTPNTEGETLRVSFTRYPRLQLHHDDGIHFGINGGDVLKVPYHFPTLSLD